MNATTMAAPTHFHAKWEGPLKAFEPKIPTTAEKVRKIAWTIFSIIIPVIIIWQGISYLVGKALLRFVILPSAFISKAKREKAKEWLNDYWHGEITQGKWQQKLRDHFTHERHLATTPDNVTLNINFFRHVKSDENTPIVIGFQPNPTLADGEIYRWHLKHAVKKGAVCNFLTFDYRPGEFLTDTKKLSVEKMLTIDGYTIVDWVRHNFPKSKIHFYGYSLGGLTAVRTQALDPALNGRHGNERSFSGSDELLKIYEPYIGPTLFSIAKNIVHDEGLEMDAVAPFKEIQGETMVFGHPDDNMIPGPASLGVKVEKIANHVLTLKQKPIITPLVGENFGHHSLPLEYYKFAETNKNAQNAAGDFIILGIRPEKTAG